MLRMKWNMVLKTLIFFSLIVFFHHEAIGEAITPPDPPAGLATIAGNGEATLSWNASSGATSYIVYRSTNISGPYSFTARTQGISHMDHSLSNGTTYYYMVTALNEGGESAYSAKVSVVPTTTVLKAPTNLKVVPGNTQASITWDKVTSAVSYNLFRSTGMGGPYTLVGNAPGPSITDLNLLNGTKYYYVVQTLSTTSGSYSDEISVTPVADLLLPPETFTVAPGSNWASLSWSAVPGATYYVVYRSETVGGPYSPVAMPNTTSYADTGLTNNTTYYYRVATVNTNAMGAFSAEASAAVSAAKMPQAPVLTATRGDGQANLCWNNPAGAVSYKVYRGTTSGGPYSDLGVQNSCYNNTGLSNGTTYYYVVDALNASPTAARSNEVSVTPVAVMPTPGNVSVINGNTQVTITWNPVPGVYGYIVSSATSPGGPYSYIGGSGTSTKFTDSTLTNGVTYYYVVQAQGGGNSAYSAEVSATPSVTLPLAPTNLSLTGGNTQLSVTWDEVSGATGYNVYRRTDGSSWALAGTVTAGPFQDTGLTNGTRYYYSVSAVNAAGEGAWSDENSAIPSATAQFPPLNPAVINGNTQVTITWNPVPGVYGYIVSSATSPGGPYSYIGGSGTSTKFTDSTLTNGVTYYYVVQAQGGGNSAYSAEVSATPSESLPFASTSLSLTGGNTQLSLTWNAVSGAISYKVYRRTGQSAWASVGTSTGLVFNDSGLTNGTTYYYSVSAVNATGEGAWSDETYATPTATAALAPANVVVINGNTQVTIKWDPVANATDYILYRSASSGGPYSYIGSSSGNTNTKYTDSSLANGTTYYYVVMAYGTANSAYSSEVSATPSSALPYTPTIQNITTGDKVLTVNWGTVPGATGYKVYRRTDSAAWALLGSTTSISYADTGLTNGTTYYYSVAAVNASGTGAWSEESSGVPADTVPPTGSISINSGAPYTAVTSVTLTLSCSDANGCAEMMLSNDYSYWTPPETYATTKEWTIDPIEGVRTVYVKFKDNAGNWSAAFSDTIVLGTPDISASPTSLNFGNVNVGVTSASQTVTVTNVGTGNLSISAVTLTGTNSSEYTKQIDTCSGNTLPLSENCNIQIAFMPASAGPKTAGLAITSNDPDTSTLNIPLSGTGVQPVWQGPLDLVLTCPTNVTAGNALSVTVKLYNYDCTNSISVNRLITQLMGNSSGTLMGLGIWGPYNKSIATKTVPQATCDEFGNVTPGGPVSFSLTIMTQTPASLAGKMAEVTVDAITSKGESIGSGSCMVNVQ